ncbi:putative 2-phosphosulfolactate phosphatase [Caulifigura coniformis]|uniref:Probable 2-phosphosulfolactate phosphatase n=1 Tax=Caulifigura coniformis TaxID=2527983 RepID=A0A517SF43_9PLAN|nr:2-phosphosulfolactate phosphatase [Caulifigura coniformis]QDT54764.1 putative 2-phosphosulfolactate phosphatase [Caulifigura coniformis]
MPRVQVALLPSTLRDIDLSGSVAVVIDVLRATTTIIHALAAGAREVIPCREVEEAFAARDRLGADECALGGERHGLLIPGFQLDNSPFSYTSGTVGGKSVVFTTTNGTRALAACESASAVVCAGFVNRSAIVDWLKSDGRPVWIVCAGTDGLVTAEDVLVAGGIAVGLLGTAPSGPMSVAEVESLDPARGDACALAVQFYNAHGLTDALRLEAMRTSRGGSNLIENGFDRDIARAAEDSRAGLDIVPEFRDGRITVI